LKQRIGVYVVGIVAGTVSLLKDDLPFGIYLIVMEATMDGNLEEDIEDLGSAAGG
jgi:hypothetical protein